MCTTCFSCLFGGKMLRFSPPSVSDQKNVKEAGKVKVLQENPIFSPIGSYDSRDDNASHLVHHGNIQTTAKLTEFPLGVNSSHKETSCTTM